MSINRVNKINQTNELDTAHMGLSYLIKYDIGSAPFEAAPEVAKAVEDAVFLLSDNPNLDCVCAAKKYVDEALKGEMAEITRKYIANAATALSEHIKITLFERSYITYKAEKMYESFYRYFIENNVYDIVKGHSSIEGRNPFIDSLDCISDESMMYESEIRKHGLWDEYLAYVGAKALKQ